MAENRTSEILPYRFEPESVSSLTVDDSSSSESETDIREQASFTKRLASTSWCECAKPVYSHDKWRRVSVLQGNGGR